MRWDEFERAAPDFAERRTGRPALRPFVPFTRAESSSFRPGRRLRRSATCRSAAATPYTRFWGQATRIGDDGARARVHAAIRFQFDAEDPVFALDVKRCRWGYWVNPGRPGTYPVHKRWP